MCHRKDREEEEVRPEVIQMRFQSAGMDVEQRTHLFDPIAGVIVLATVSRTALAASAVSSTGACL